MPPKTSIKNLKKYSSQNGLSSSKISIPKKWLKPEPYFKANLLFQNIFQSPDIKNEKNYI